MSDSEGEAGYSTSSCASSVRKGDSVERVTSSLHVRRKCVSQDPHGTEYQGYPASYPPPGINSPPAGGYVPPYPIYRPHYPGPMPPSTNPWAIASLICSIVGIAILGIIFGHIALSEIKRSNGWQEGRGMALAGLIIGYIEIGLTVLVLIVVLGLTLSLKRLPM